MSKLCQRLSQQRAGARCVYVHQQPCVEGIQLWHRRKTLELAQQGKTNRCQVNGEPGDYAVAAGPLPHVFFLTHTPSLKISSKWLQAQSFYPKACFPSRLPKKNG